MNVAPTREELPALHGQSPRFFANWLRRGIGGVVVDREGRDAFPGAANFIGWSGVIEGDLALIAAALHEDEQDAFRAGLVQALAEESIRPGRWALVCETLLRLGTLLRVYDVLDVIPAIGLKAEMLPMEERVRFGRACVDVVVELANPAPRAVRCLTLMISSPGFRPEIAGNALLALAGADPDRFPEHLDALEQHLNLRYPPDLLDCAGERTTEERDALLLALGARLPRQSMAAAFDAGRRRRGAEGSDWMAIDWFCRGLVGSADPAVRELLAEVAIWSGGSSAVSRPQAVASAAEDDFELVLERALGFYDEAGEGAMAA